MLRGVWQALNCHFIHATFCMIATGAFPGQTKNEDKVEANESDPRQLWRLVDDLLGRGRVPASSAFDVETLMGGSTLGPGGHRPPKCWPALPQIFWFQQQKYVFLKYRLFLYSGEINTRIS